MRQAFLFGIQPAHMLYAGFIYTTDEALERQKYRGDSSRHLIHVNRELKNLRK